MKNIIFISPHSDLYGAERSLVSMMIGARVNGYNPILLLNKNGPIESKLQDESIEYHIVPFRQCINVNGKSDYIRGIKDYIRNRQTLKKFLKANQEMCNSAVLVHTNSVITMFGVMLARAITVPHIQHIREFGKEDFNMEFNLGKRLTAHIFNYSSRIICISDSVFNTYKNFFDIKKMIRIYNGIGINVNTTSEERKNKLNKDIVKMVLVGRLSKEKGQMVAIKACELLVEKGITDFELHFYGNGVDEKKLKTYVYEHHLNKNILFKGYCPEIDYSMYDIALMTSKAEAFGRVTVEYMFNALPVVGIASGGTLEIVLDNETGLLSERGDVVHLSMNIEKLLLNEEYRVKLGRNGKERADALFTEKAYVNNIMSLYSEIVNK